LRALATGVPAVSAVGAVLTLLILALLWFVAPLYRRV